MYKETEYDGPALRKNKYFWIEMINNKHISYKIIGFIVSNRKRTLSREGS